MSESPFISFVNNRPVYSGSIGGLSNNRLIDLNLINLIKEVILPINGYVNRSTDTVSPGGQGLDPETGLTVTSYKLNNDSIYYYNPDPTNPALTGLLTTPILSQSSNLAYIDYQNGIICYSGIMSNDVTATYDYSPVYVQDGYPDWGEDITGLDEIKVPLISIDAVRRTNKSFAIGGAYQENRYFLINVTASSDPQRDDLVDILEDSLKYDYNRTIDYRPGFPLKFNGDKNPEFDRNNRWQMIRFNDVSSMVIRRPELPEKLRHQANVLLVIQTY